MGLSRFSNSVFQILTNAHINRPLALSKHMAWQFRKLFNLFPVELPLSSSRLVAASPTCGVSALVNSQGMYDYNNMHLVRLLTSAGGTYIDIGANIGSYTLIASEALASMVVAIEAHPSTYELLVNNVALNQRRNVLLLNFVAGATDGRTSITNTPGSSTTHIAASGADVTISVPMARMERVLAETGVRPDYVKVDVEGFEMDVLVGFGLRISEVQVLFVEINQLGSERNGGPGDLKTFLNAQGMIGPFQFDYDRRVFAPWQLGAREDAIFLAEGFLHSLTDRFGLSVVDREG